MVLERRGVVKGSVLGNVIYILPPSSFVSPSKCVRWLAVPIRSRSAIQRCVIVVSCYVFFWRRKNCRIYLADIFGEVPEWDGKLLPECRDLIARIRRDWKFSNCREGVVIFFELGW